MEARMAGGVENADDQPSVSELWRVQLLRRTTVFAQKQRTTIASYSEIIPEPEAEQALK